MPANIPVIEDSPLNFVQFVDAEFPQHPSVHNLYAGQNWEEKTYAPGQAQIPYKYPAEFADPITLQFHCSYSGVQDTKLQLFRVINKGHEQVAIPFYTFPTPNVVYVSGNAGIIPENGVSVPLLTFDWKASYNQIPNIEPGIYYFVITMAYSNEGGSVSNRWRSKKSGHIDLRFSHPKTILLSATNRTNDYDTVFVQNNMTFYGRTYGAVLNYNPESEDGSFTTQRRKVRKLFSFPDSTRTLVIGGNKGIPHWVKAWANYVMACDYKSVDKIEITKDDESQWEQIGAGPNYALGGMSMPIKFDQRHARTTIIRSYVTLFDRPPGGRYQVVNVGISKGADPVVVLGTNIMVLSRYDEIVFLQKIQAEIQRKGLKGYISLVNGQYRYINDFSEEYNISFYLVIIPL